MARYLTPAKVGLLVLVDLYGDGVVPSDAILPVLSFVASHLLGYGITESLLKQPSKETDGGRSVSFVLTIKDFEKLLGSYPFLLGMPGRRLWDQFLEKLWGINSLDAFHSFVDNLSRFLAKSKGELRGLGDGDPSANPGIKLSRHSILGAFVRRSKIELTRLRWHDSAELWKEFVRFRQPTAEHMRRKNPAFELHSFDNVLLLGGRDDWSPEGISALTEVIYGDVLMTDNANPPPVSTDDVEKLLEFQIEQMQSKTSETPHISSANSVY
jgi:anaphase-promoting complex subunit 5